MTKKTIVLLVGAVVLALAFGTAASVYAATEAADIAAYEQMCGGSDNGCGSNNSTSNLSKGCKKDSDKDCGGKCKKDSDKDCGGKCKKDNDEGCKKDSDEGCKKDSDKDCGGKCKKDNDKGCGGKCKKGSDEKAA